MLSRYILIQAICSGIIAGIILFQSIIIAPTIFTNLESKDSSKIIRTIFPKLFIFLTMIGLVSLSSSFLFDENNATNYYVSFFTVIASIVCYLLIPMTNIATDNGEKKKFFYLHTFSVITTLIILVLNIIWIFLI